MMWEVFAAEDLNNGDFVEFIAEPDGSLSCKKATNPDSITAMAARDIIKGELLIFDTTDNTADLVRLKDPFSRA